VRGKSENRTNNPRAFSTGIFRRAAQLGGVAARLSWLFVWSGIALADSSSGSALDPFGQFFDEIRLSVTIHESAAENYDLDESRLLSALKERAVSIIQQYKSGLNVTVEDASAFFGPDPPGTDPWPKEIHCHFDIEVDRTDPTVLVVTVTSRRGHDYRRTGPIAPTIRIDARCAESGCVYVKIIDGVSDVLATFVRAREASGKPPGAPNI
jgi:hypothetical protein